MGDGVGVRVAGWVAVAAVVGGAVAVGMVATAWQAYKHTHRSRIGYAFLIALWTFLLAAG
ncbi:MAG: hypothetical protein WHV66_01540 [Anaerolineales bacterium]